MKNNYTIELNDKKYEASEFVKNAILPETIQSLKIDFSTDNESGVSFIALFLLLTAILEKVKNKNEYSILIENLMNSIVVLKKLEMDTGLDEVKF